MKSCWIVTKDHKNVLEFRDVPQPQPKAGEIVMTGTCVVPVPVSAGDTMTADFGSFGQVRARFKA